MTKKRLRSIIGENIRSERISRNISMDELAELLKLTPGFVGLIERGQRGATATTLLKLSDIFDMPVDLFFHCKEDSSLSLEEEPAHQNLSKRKKVESLIADFSNEELDFVISMLKNLRAMNRYDFEANDDDGQDEEV